jgi:hypothetical protein
MDEIMHAARTLAGVLLLALHAAAAAGQTRPARAPTRVPATVAIIDRLPGGSSAPYLVLRHAHRDPHDVIVLRASAANAAVLSAAVRDLLAIRSVQGDTASVSSLARVRPRSPTARGPRYEFPWAGRVLNQLRAAEPHPLDALGVVRSIEVWLPPTPAWRPG